MTSLKAETSASNTNKVASQNKWAQLFYGMILGMTGQANKVKGLNKCLPKKWTVVNTSNSAALVKLESPKVQKILKKISSIVKFICKFKKQIRKLFITRIKLNNRKLFLQKMEKYQGRWNPKRLNKALKTITQNAVRGIRKVADNAAKSVNQVAQNAAKNVEKIAQTAGEGFQNISKETTKGIKAAARRVGKHFVKGFEDVATLVKKQWKDVIQLGKKAIKIIKRIFSMIKAKFQAIMRKKWVKLFFKKIIPCSKKIKGSAIQIHGVLSGIHKKLTLLMSAGYAGFAKVFIDLVCNFDRFREAVQALLNGMKQIDTLKKFHFYGQFIGTLLRALSGKKVLRLHFFLMNY